ncbi:FAD-binding oxidoreductase [Streptomyces sp. NPDC006365]|uniref:FAD-binding oxidoreductase n=1 Tax=Streptomyces sp. NPDC006365 TaxID=3364744 RepID=UPI0036B1E927
MSGTDRRTLITRVGTLAGAASVAALSPRPAQAAPSGTTDTGHGAAIRSGDLRYATLTTGNNQRFVARPEYFRVIRSAADAESALRRAVDDGKKVSVRSGGHCFADLVCNPGVEVLLDFSEMTDVSYDPSMRAFAVEPGARLLNVYETLFKGWGVTLPGGMCYSVGAGGHVAGGGYGMLSRAHGLVVDHLYAVEVVVVDRSGGVRTVVATREEDDPHRDLWWAHTGGGGGNFGLVTRYWFRSPGARGAEPDRQLVRPPAGVLVSALSFPWEQLNEQRFGRLLRNYGAWHKANSAPDSPSRALSSVFNLCHRAHGTLDLFTQVDAGAPDADKLLINFLKAITAGTGLTATALSKPSGDLAAMPHLATPRRLPWLNATRLLGTSNPTLTHPSLRADHKSAYMRTGLDDHQVATLHHHLTSEAHANPDAMVVLLSFGGRVNAISPSETASVQRSSAFKMLFQSFWGDPAQDEANIRWVRELYEDFFHAAGGVPAPGERYQGCYINYPDTDLRDPHRNRSGIPWHTLYYGDNYQRLQQTKRLWDPSGFFHHSLSVEP